MSLLRWLGISSLLGIVGVLGFAYLATRIALAGGGDAVRETQIAVVIWAQVVLCKALLPHVWITIAVCRGIEGRLDGRVPSVGWLVIEVLGVAAVTSFAVVTLVLTADLPGLPSVSVHGAARVARTCLELTAGTALVVGVPRLWANVSRRRARAGEAAGTSQPV